MESSGEQVVVECEIPDCPCHLHPYVTHLDNEGE